MTRAPYGTLCTLSPYRWLGTDPPPGADDYLQSAGGSVYLILAARPISGDPHRLRLTCVRTDPATVPAGARVCNLRWDQRQRKRPGGTLRQSGARNP